MLCRITDEMYYEDEDEVEETPNKHLEEITLYDLMGQDFDVYLRENKTGFDIEIDSEDGEFRIKEKGINYAAIDTMADFCTQFLGCYNRIMK